MNDRWRQRVLIIVGLLVAYLLRVYKLGDQNIWWDEGLSVLAARKSFVDATLWTAADVHPPLYFWLLWGWQRLAGETEFVLRYITVIESLLTVALLYAWGRRLARPAVGVGALWLLALSRFHIWWSQEMRMYILAGFCSLLSLYFVTRLATGRSERRSWLGWLLATTGALYTIYSSILLVLIENLFVLFVGWRRRDRWSFWGRWVGWQLGVAALLLPWLALALPRMRSWSVVQEPASLSFVLQLNAVLLTLGISTYIGRYLFPSLLLLVGIVGGVSLLFSQKEGAQAKMALVEKLFLLLTGILTPPVLIWLLTQPRSFFYTPRVEARYLLPFAPVFYLLLAWALAGWLSHRRLKWIGYLLSGGVLLLAGWTLPQHYQPRYLQDDYHTLTRIIWRYAQPDDLVVLVSGSRYPLFLNYYERRPAPENLPLVFQMPDPPGEEEFDAAHVDAVLQELASEYGRIWLAEIESGLQDPAGLTAAWLAEHYERPLSYDFDYNRISLFAPSAAEPTVPVANLQPQHAVSAQLAPGVELLGYELLTSEFRSGDTIRLGLYLSVREPAELKIKQVGQDGREVAADQLELLPREGIIYRQGTVHVTPYTPAQEYHFELESGADELLEIANFAVTHTEPAVEVAQIPYPQRATVAENIELLGYALPGKKRGAPPTVRPGDTLTVKLYWQTEKPIERSYKIFTHLIGTEYNPATNGPLWAQDDQIALEGAYPTDQWLPDIPLEDQYELVIPPTSPAGEYQLVVGMYTLEDGKRLSVLGEGARPEAGYILLTKVHIVP